jgi:hypothetical protein
MIHKRPKQRPLQANQQPTILGRHYRVLSTWTLKARNLLWPIACQHIGPCPDYSKVPRFLVMVIVKLCIIKASNSDNVFVQTWPPWSMSQSPGLLISDLWSMAFVFEFEFDKHNYKL